MPQTDRFTPVVNHLVDLFETRKPVLGLESVWYGDQTLIPKTPALAIEAGPYGRALSGIGGKGRTDNAIRIYGIVYLNRIQDVESLRRETDELAESCMDVMHEDITLGGLVIQGHVTLIEPGYTVRNGAMFRSARITWEGLTKTLIA